MKAYLLNLIDRAGKNSIFSSFLNLGSIQVSNILLLVLLHPILSRKIGDTYGMTMVANSFSMLLGIIVNYGTNQSGIKDIALSKDNDTKRGSVFYNVLFLRLIICLIFVPFFALAAGMDIDHYSYFLLAVPLIFAEVLNPLFLYIGMERLALFNIVNVGIKALVLASVLFLISGPEDAPMVNFYMGLFHIAGYLVLIVYAIWKFNLPITGFSQLNYKTMLKNNFYLVCNSMSTHLQQSMMLFAIAKWGSSNWLYAYSIGDKFIWSIRILIISVTNAIYPKAAVVFNESETAFLMMKYKYKRFLGWSFGVFSLVVFVAAPLIVEIYTGGSDDQVAVLFLRLMSLSPMLAALNALNIIHLLIADQNKQILKIGILLLLSSGALTAITMFSKNIYLTGFYAVLIEGVALILFTRSLKASNQFAAN